MELRRLRVTENRSAQWLADRTSELGNPISRTVIADLENGRRRYVTTAELVILAAALDTAPIMLLYPNPDQDAEREVAPNVFTPELWAHEWFSGFAESRVFLRDSPAKRALPDDLEKYERNIKRLKISTQLQQLRAQKSRYITVELGPPDEKEAMERRMGFHIVRVIDGIQSQIDELEAELKEINGGG